MRTSSGRSHSAAIVQWTLTALVLVFVTWSLRDSFAALEWRQVEIDYLLLAAGGAGFALYLLASAALWHLLTRWHGVSLPTVRALATWACSILGKYVPGKALMWLIRYQHYRKHGTGVRPTRLIRCFFLEYFGGTAAGFALVLAILAVVPVGVVPDRWRWVGVVLLGACALAIHPRLLQALEQRLAHRVGLEPAGSSISVAETSAVVVLYGLDWMLLGVAVHLLAMALSPALGWDLYLYITASYTVAGLAGFLAFFAPSGVGVREGIFIAAVSRIMPVETAVVLAVLVRLVATLAEVAAAVAGLLYNRVAPTRAAISPPLEAADETRPPPL